MTSSREDRRAADVATGDWLKGAAVYHIYVRSFQDSTGNGTGDLRGVLDRLPHIVSLGADAIWLSPFYVSPMEDMGYDIADHCNVDPLFGTLDDFDALVSAAHGAGLKVMTDLVFSHTSDRHAWFQESSTNRTNAKADWYVWADPKPDGTPPNNWLSIAGGSAWTWNRDRAQYYLHDFLPSQPSLDFSNEAVRHSLLDIARFWVERGVDAFRLDTLNSYFHDRELRDNPPLPSEEGAQMPKPNPFWQQLHLYDRAQLGDLGPLENFVAAVETLGASTVVGEIGNRLKARDGQVLAHCYTYCLPRVGFDAGDMRKLLDDVVDQSPDGRIAWAFSNHDTARHVSRFGGHGEEAAAVARLCVALLTCLPGAIMLYQGEELGLGEAEIPYKFLRDPLGLAFWPELRGRDGCRTPMPWDADAENGGFSIGESWLPVQVDHLERSVARQVEDPASVLAFYREALAFRKQCTALREGDFTLDDSDDAVLAFTRLAGAERIVAIFNMSRESAFFEPKGGITAVDTAHVLDGSAMPAGAHFEFPPFGYFVGRL